MSLLLELCGDLSDEDILKSNPEHWSPIADDVLTLGTKDAPLSVAQALTLINALADKAESEKFAYVKGKVVKVTTNQTNFEKYGNLNYLISDDGTENSTITVYSGDGLNGAKFSGPGDLEPGDEVIVYGKLYKYVNNSGAVTPEINKGNYLVSLVKGQGGGGGGFEPIVQDDDTIILPTGHMDGTIDQQMLTMLFKPSRMLILS